MRQYNPLLNTNQKKEQNFQKILQIKWFSQKWVEKIQVAAYDSISTVLHFLTFWLLILTASP